LGGVFAVSGKAPEKSPGKIGMNSTIRKADIHNFKNEPFFGLNG